MGVKLNTALGTVLFTARERGLLLAMVCYLALLAGARLVAQAPGPGTPDPSVASSPEEIMKLIQASRESLAKWMETQKIIAQEEANWKTAKVALDGRIALLQQEISEFEGKVSKSDTDIKAEETRKANLERELASARAAPKTLLDGAAFIEDRLKAMKPLLPGPVFVKVQQLYQRIPDDPNTTKASLAERYQNILGILNETDKANNDIMVTSEVRDIPGVQPAEVETIYVGLAQAYFVNADRDFAGYGHPVNGKWQWTRQDELSGEIAHILSIMKSKGKPHFIHLPAKLD
jgi:hypothetical protein